MAAFPPVLLTDERYAIAFDLGTTRSALSIQVTREDYRNQFDICPDTQNSVQKADCKTETVLVFSSAAALGTTDKPVTFDSPVTNAKYETVEGWVHIGLQSVIDAGELAAAEVSPIQAFYVRDFKMELDVQSKRAKNPTQEIRLNDIEVTAYPLHNGDPIRVNLRQVMTAYIACAAHIAFAELAKHIQNTKDPVLAMPSKDDVNWVITVPAIWTDQARIFMRDVAHAAGLTRDTFATKISICLEPEGAVLEAIRTSYIHNPAVLRDHSVLVLDWGGGTCDVTFSIVRTPPDQTAATLEELSPPLGGPYGGRMLNMMIDEMIFLPWFGPRLHKTVWIDQGFRDRFIRDFLEPTKQIALNSAWQFNFYDLFQDFVPNEDLIKGLEAVNAGRESKLIELKPSRDTHKFEIPFAVIESCFAACIEPMLKMIQPLINHEKRPRCIFVVGGMANSPYLKNHLMNSPLIPADRLIFHENASMTIVRGAVPFALNPDYRLVRRARTNYGLGLFNRDNPDLPRWGLLISKGEQLTTRIERGPYAPPNEDTSRLTFGIYECDDALLEKSVLTPKCYWVTSIIVDVDTEVPFGARSFRIEISVDGPVISGTITNVNNGSRSLIKWGSR